MFECGLAKSNKYGNTLPREGTRKIGLGNKELLRGQSSGFLIGVGFRCD